MRALVVDPGRPGTARTCELPEPAEAEGTVLVQTLAVGVCGTDREIAAGEYGQAPDGEPHLVLGHESLGRVLSAPAESGLAEGQHVVAMVRHPDPEPCVNCAAGQWDLCRNDGYTEHGIKGRHGFARERFRVDADRLVPVDAALGLAGVLLEPASVVAKAWELVEHAASRSAYRPRTVLVTGAGPIGLLAALLGVQRGLEVHVLDRVQDGPKPELVAALGATYHATDVASTGVTPDVVIECTGAPTVVLDALSSTAPDGITCLNGVSTGGRPRPVDVGALNRSLVLQNDVVLGSVNANRRHYEQAAGALAQAGTQLLDRLITRRLPLEAHADALAGPQDDIKVVLELARTPVEAVA